MYGAVAARLLPFDVIRVSLPVMRLTTVWARYDVFGKDSWVALNRIYTWRSEKRLAGAWLSQVVGFCVTAQFDSISTQMLVHVYI